jgi:hypothetical protein
VPRIVAALLVVVAAVAVGASAAQAPPNVTGVLVIPRAFACRSGEPCDPAAPRTLLFTRSGRIIAQARVTTRGRFALRLAAGRYGIRLSPAPSPWTLSPQTVRVPSTTAASLRLTLVR